MPGAAKISTPTKADGYARWVAILVQCDQCGVVVGAVWSFRDKRWHTPGQWEPFGVWDQGHGIARHACSAECQEALQRTVNEDPEVLIRRRGFRLVGGGKGDGA